ncbi:hypothetical protein AAC387_Pa02g4876 [Persea americana]
MRVFLRSERRKSGSAAFPPYLVAIKRQNAGLPPFLAEEKPQMQLYILQRLFTNSESADVGGIIRGKVANGAFTAFVMAKVACAVFSPRIYQNLTLPSCGRLVPS